ncbi:unnamed protein product [Rotaria socialis]|uniref:Uncharacterized protein n=1 Tax=Rotaria socialis TaxID=392032 RepID=A0A817WB18_9BILA|nr:unnamed protein product [Rotaria socialis]
MNDQDCLFKYRNENINKSSQYISSLLDISIRLSDFHATDRFCSKQNNTSHVRSHHQRKARTPICYRNFPFSSNNPLKYSRNHQSTVQSKSYKDNELNISVSILKLSNKNIDSFTYFGTNTTASVGPSKQNKSINDEVDFRNEQQQCAHSFAMIKNNQKSYLNYSFKQYATTISAPKPILKDESNYAYTVSLKTILSTRWAKFKTYKSPLRPIIITSDIIPATILILMIHTSAIILIKMPSLSLMVLESESVNLWQHKPSLYMALTDNITAGIDHQKVIPEEDQSRISNDLTNRLHPNKDVQHTIVASPTDNNLEKKFVSDINVDDDERLISNDGKSLLNFSEKFTSKVKIKEHRKLNDNLVIDNLNSIDVLTSNLLMSQTFEILPTIDGFNQYKSILNSKSNLSSSHAVDQLISERKELKERFTIDQDMIHSTNSTEYIPSIFTTNSFSAIDATKCILSNEDNLENTLDESSIKNAMLADSDDTSGQSINLETIGLPLFDKESKSTLEKNQIHENDGGVQVISKLLLSLIYYSPFFPQDLDQHEITLLKHSISLQSNASLSKTHALAFLCQRNTLQSDKDLPALHDVSVPNSIHFETKIQQKESNEAADEFPVMATSRKPINNINEYKELSLIFPKHAGRRKRLRKQQHNEPPPWIFPKENSTTYNHRFRRPQCKPCECICTPLPTCSNVTSRSFIEDIHPCDTYSMH